MCRGKILCSQAKEIVNTVYNYFAQLERCCAGRGALKEDIGSHRFVSSVRSLALLLKTLRFMCYICVGIAQQAITSVRQETSCGSAVFIPDKVVLSEEMVCIGRFLRLQGC